MFDFELNLFVLIIFGKWCQKIFLTSFLHFYNYLVLITAYEFNSYLFLYLYHLSFHLP